MQVFVWFYIIEIYKWKMANCLKVPNIQNDKMSKILES